MLITIRQAREFILSIIAVSLIIFIFLNPPTDSDGGPMMAYNFLFFFPLVLLIGILSIISIIIAITKLIRKKSEKKVIQIISLSLSALAFIYFLSIVIRAITIANHAYDNIDEYLMWEDTYNSSDSIKVTDNKTIHLVGYNWGGKDKDRRLYVSLKPYKIDDFNIVETYCLQGDSSMVIYYQAKLDSIFVYQSSEYSNSSVYTYVNATELDKIPLRTIQLSKKKLDSLIVSDYDKKIKKFEWK